MLRVIVSSAVVVAVLTPLAAQSAASSPEAIARALQQRYAGIRDFRADFESTIRGGVLPTESRGEGSVWVKKPGRMRWVYTKPERQEIVSDGTTIYQYFPDDREALKYPAPGDDQATTSALFLAGKGDIARDFVASDAPSPIPGTIGLKLTPRESDPEYAYLILALDPASLQIRALVNRDHQGGDTTIAFRNMKENTNVADRTFVFTPPRGVTVTVAGQPN